MPDTAPARDWSATKDAVRAPAQDAPRKQFPTVHLTGGAAQND